MTAPPSFLNPSRWLALAILLAGTAVYANSFRGVFVFDDIAAIVQNPSIRRLWPVSQVVPPSPQATPAFHRPIIFHRPVIVLSLAINYALGGLSVFGYHLFNLVVHLAAALTLFGISRRTLRLPALADRYGSAADGLAGAIALIWVVHPLLTESVTYILQRTESVMGLCHLLVIYGLIRSADSPRPARWHAVAVAACAVGMGSKESMVSAPLTAIVYDRLFLSSSWRELWRDRRWLYVGLASTWVLLGVFIVMGPQPKVAGWNLKHLSPLAYLGTQCVVVFHYVRLAFWPHPLILSYEWEPVRSLVVILPLALVVLSAGTATLIGLSQGWPGAFLGAWWFFGLGPTSVTPMVSEIVAERRMYLPLISLMTLVVMAGYRLLGLIPSGRLSARQRGGVSVLVLALVVVALGSGTVRRNRDYQSNSGIWADVIRNRPGNARAYTNLGNALMEEGRVDDAIAEYRRALGEAPGYRAVPSYGRPLIFYGLGTALQRKGLLEDAAKQYRQVIRLKPTYRDAKNNLGLVLAQLGRPEEATQELSEAVHLDPDAWDVRLNLGTVLEEAGRMEEAIRQYREAIRLYPGSAFARNNLGVALAKQGRFEEAVAALAEAQRLEPDDAEIAANLQEAQENQARQLRLKATEGRR